MVGLFLSATVATAAFAMAERSGQGARPASRPGTPRPSPPAHALPADAAPTTTIVPTTTVPTLPPAPPNPPAPGALSTDPAAWAGHGDLAFVSRGQLFVLDNAGQLSTITGPAAGGFDSGPSWSVGGQWLAFLHTDASSGFSIPAPTLWLAAADSTIAHEVTPQGVTMFAWSPVTAELAFSVAISTNGTAPVPENLYVDEPGSSPVRLPIGSGNGVEDLAWSPDGRQIAFDDAEYAQPATATSPATPSAGQLGVISATGGSAHIAFRLLGTNVRVAAWWPQGGGLLFWEAPGFEEAADGLTLYSLASGTSTPVPLLASLVAPLWVAPEPGGGTVAVVVGTGRSIWSTGRDVELCTLPSAQCRPVNVSAGTESLAPSWTASGALLFSEASTAAPFGSEGNAYWTPGFMALWDATSTEWGLTSAGAPSRLASAPPGTQTASPATGGTSVLYVADDEVWLASTASSAPAVMVAGPLYSDEAPSGFYGQVDWPATFSWSLAGTARQISAELLGEALEPAATP